MVQIQSFLQVKLLLLLLLIELDLVVVKLCIRLLLTELDERFSDNNAIGDIAECAFKHLYSKTDKNRAHIFV